MLLKLCIAAGNSVFELDWNCFLNETPSLLGLSLSLKEAKCGVRKRSMEGTDKLMREDFRSHGKHSCDRCHCSANTLPDCALAFDWQEAKMRGQKLH